MPIKPSLRLTARMILLLLSSHGTPLMKIWLVLNLRIMWCFALEFKQYIKSTMLKKIDIFSGLNLLNIHISNKTFDYTSPTQTCSCI